MKLVWNVLATAVCVALVGASHAEAVEYSADMVMRAEGKQFEAKTAVKGSKSRMEIVGATMIHRGDLGVSWTLMPGQNMYMEHKIDPQVLAQTGAYEDADVLREALGKDEVDGRAADKYKITYSHEGAPQSVYQWSVAGDIPVKVAAVDGSWEVQYNNLQSAGVSDSLFEVPAGYQKFEMPSMAQSMGALGQDGS